MKGKYALPMFSLDRTREAIDEVAGELRLNKGAQEAVVAKLKQASALLADARAIIRFEGVQDEIKTKAKGTTT